MLPQQSDPVILAPERGMLPPAPVSVRGSGLKAWVRRLGVAGFLFFFIKGLAWLALPALLARQVMDGMGRSH